MIVPFKVDAANVVVTCNYDEVRFIDNEDDKKGSSYIKLKMTLYDDKTVLQQYYDDSKNLKTIPDHSALFSTYRTKDSDVGTLEFFFLPRKANDLANDFVKYYEFSGNQCPVIKVNNMNYEITYSTPTDCVNTDTYTVCNKVSKAEYPKNETTGEEVKPPNQEVDTVVCEYKSMNSNNADITFTTGFEIQYKMTSKGKRCATIRLAGSGSANNTQTQCVDANGYDPNSDNPAITLIKTDSHGETYTFIIKQNQVNKIWNQINFQDINNHRFSCPGPGEIRIVEESFSERRYILTTDTTEEGNGNSSTLNEGTLQENGETERWQREPINWDSLGENITLDCNDKDIKALMEDFNRYYQLIEIIIPILIILFGSIDLTKAVLNQDKDSMQKSIQSFIKRCIAGLAIYFLPVILETIFNLPGLPSSSDFLCQISMILK